MSLAKYREKRNFEATPEPGPRAEASSGGNLFCIQRHDATRLHYDFRLEINGAMASWAVAKGPSLDPDEKRLAVKVEDHPLSYANFEGNIPKGNYGGGSVMVWDLGAWEPVGDATIAEQMERGDFKFRLEGKKLRGNFVLVRMKKSRSGKEEWLLIKKKDEYASKEWNIDDYAVSVLSGRTQEEIAADTGERKRDPFPGAIKPMLAARVKDVPAGPDWVFEIKWDGVRALAYIRNGKLTLMSRRGDDITRQYPELAKMPKEVAAKEAVLDGEVVVCDDEGRPRFELIQPRIMGSARQAGSPAQFIAFDLLFVDGEDLRSRPLRTRAARLVEVVKDGNTARVSQLFPGGGKQLLEAARQQGLEGIMAKRPESRYQSARSDDWQKIKVHNEEDFLICGYTKGERSHFGALVLGERKEGVLVYVGNVGTGFDETALRELHKRMQPLRQESSPFPAAPKIPDTVVWARPELACAIRYHERTSGGKLRTPVYAGLRETEERVDIAKFSNRNKVLFPADGITKGQLLEYYDAAAEWLVPHLKDRPLSLLRFPDGIGQKGFFQKNLEGKLPEWFRTDNVESMVVPVGNGKDELLYLTNLGCIDQNPWMSRVGSLEHPDFLLIDLDPHETNYDMIVRAALVVRGLLDDIGLEGFPKTTGGDGMHIYVPLAPIYTYDQAKGVAELMARLLAKRHPDLFTTPRAVAARTKQRVYFDWVQIGEGKTISAPYVVRPKPGAPVATPLEWKEVKTGLDPADFHMTNAITRFREKGDLFAAVLRGKQKLEKAVRTLEKIVR